MEEITFSEIISYAKIAEDNAKQFYLNAAAQAKQGLRARGVPAYIVEASDGSVRLFVGAFETPQQARLADSILTAANIEGTLVPRAGKAR